MFTLKGLNLFTLKALHWLCVFNQKRITQAQNSKHALRSNTRSRKSKQNK